MAIDLRCRILPLEGDGPPWWWLVERASSDGYWEGTQEDGLASTEEEAKERAEEALARLRADGW